jgi:hypothetical protein
MFGSQHPGTIFTILWLHDGAQQLEVHVDADLPPFGPLEKPVRGIASTARSHAGLRLLLESAFAGLWNLRASGRQLAA